LRLNVLGVHLRPQRPRDRLFGKFGKSLLEEASHLKTIGPRAVESSAHQVVALIRVERTDAGGVATFDVIGEDLEVRNRLGGGIARKQQVPVGLKSVRSLRTFLDPDHAGKYGQRIVLQLAEGLTFNHDAHRVPLPDGTTLGRAQLRVPTRGLNAARERHDWLDDVEQALLALGDALHDSDPAQAAARATR